MPSSVLRVTPLRKLYENHGNSCSPQPHSPHYLKEIEKSSDNSDDFLAAVSKQRDAPIDS
jgi:hypothetical protein